MTQQFFGHVMYTSIFKKKSLKSRDEHVRQGRHFDPLCDVISAALVWQSHAEQKLRVVVSVFMRNLHTCQRLKKKGYRRILEALRAIVTGFSMNRRLTIYWS